MHLAASLTLLCVGLAAPLLAAAEGERCPEGTTPREESGTAGRFLLCESEPDVFQGPAVGFHPGGGKAFEGEFRDGWPLGVWREWNLDGSLAAEGAYREGAREGAWALYWANGTPRAKGAYRAGQRVGVHTTFLPSGEREVEETWTDDGRGGAHREGCLSSELIACLRCAEGHGVTLPYTMRTDGGARPRAGGRLALRSAKVASRWGAQRVNLAGPYGPARRCSS
jgi:hypothetical protein